jgi:NAD+ kinase
MTEQTDRILVATKKSRYQQLVLEAHDKHIQTLLESQDVSVATLKRSHNAHMASLDKICATLDARALPYEVRWHPEVRDPERYRLVIACGGDGTVLDLSHRLTHTPMLAINSDPQASIGYFCAGDADAFEALLVRTLEARWAPMALRRFSISINDELQTVPALNDVLVCHANPAAVSSYILRLDGIEEHQRSSGIWIATPAGSTAAIRSAGGMVVPLGSNTLQYLIREPYPPPTGAYRLSRGLRPFDSSFEIISRMQDGRIYLDGPHICYPFQTGDRLRLVSQAPPLLIYGLDEKRRAV